PSSRWPGYGPGGYPSLRRTMTDTSEPERESRVCAKCGVEDTHSHHIQYTAFVHPVTGEPQDLSVTKHTQCCAEAGCEICATHVEHAEAHPDVEDHTTPNDQFTAFMISPPDELHQAMFEKHSIESPNFTVNLGE